MGFFFEADEPVRDGARRVVRELVEGAMDLARSDGDVDDRIHEIRKNMKKARAVFRLVRLSTDRYSEENARYRDVARLLSDLRDVKACLEIPGEFLGPVRSALEVRHAEAFAEADLDRLMEEVVRRLREGLVVLEAFELDDDGFAAIRGGFMKTYRRGRERLAEAQKNGSVEVFHEWRKRAKYHRYHVDLLHRIWPPILSEWEDRLHDLTDALGEDHDCAVLEQILVDSPTLVGDPVQMEEIRAGLHAESATQRKTAICLGRKLYAEPPDAIADRFETYWDAERGT